MTGPTISDLANLSWPKFIVLSIVLLIIGVFGLNAANTNYVTSQGFAITAVALQATQTAIAQRQTSIAFSEQTQTSFFKTSIPNTATSTSMPSIAPFTNTPIPLSVVQTALAKKIIELTTSPQPTH